MGDEVGDPIRAAQMVWPVERDRRGVARWGDPFGIGRETGGDPRRVARSEGVPCRLDDAGVVHASPFRDRVVAAGMAAGVPEVAAKVARR